MKINFLDYIKSLGTERYRAIVVHHPYSRELENFAKSAERKLNGYYCNLLEYFKKYPDIPIDEFDVEDLEALLIKFSDGKPIVYVDKINFILDTWSKKEKESFYGFIDKIWNSFYPGKKAILAFFIQTYDELVQLNINDTKGKSRIHPLSNFLNIE